MPSKNYAIAKRGKRNQVYKNRLHLLKSSGAQHRALFLYKPNSSPLIGHHIHSINLLFFLIGVLLSPAAFAQSESITYREISLKLEASNGAKDISNKLYFHANGSEEKDGYDGAKLAPISSADPYLFFLQDFGNGSERLVQDARNLYPDTVQVYDLEVEDAGFSGEFTISWADFKNISNLWKLDFIDVDEDTIITMAEDSSYSFTSSRNFKISIEPIASRVEITGEAGWRVLSFPVKDAAVTEIMDDTAVQGIAGGENEAADPNIYINPASNGTAGNGYAVPENIYTPWGDGLGFIAYFFDNTMNGSTELPLMLDASGTEPDSDVIVDVSSSFTLIGNPFMSNIKLDDIEGNGSGGVNSGLKSPLYFYDSNGLNTVNFGTETVVSSWAGFFGERNDSSTTQITIPTSAKTSDAADASYFSKRGNTTFRQIELHLEAPNGQKDISNKLFFSPQSSDQPDGFDGSKMIPFDGSPYLSFIRTRNDYRYDLLVQDARAMNPSEHQKYELAVFDGGISGTYTLRWHKFHNIPEDWDFTLIDYETGASVLMEEEQSYSFEVKSDGKKRYTSVLKSPVVHQDVEEPSPRFGILLNTRNSVSIEKKDKVDQFSLDQNYPNPFNPVTHIQYTLKEAAPVSLTVFNVIGQKVHRLEDSQKPAGTYIISWNADGMAGGIYYYRLKAGDEVITRKMTLLK